MADYNTTLGLNDRVSPVLRQIMKAMDSTLTAMTHMDKASRQTFTGVPGVVNLATRAVVGFSQSVNQAAIDAQRAHNNINNAVRQTTGNYNGLNDALKSIFNTYMLWQGAKTLMTASDDYIGNTSRLGLMVDDMNTVAGLQDKIYAASQRSVSSYNEMQHSVAKLGITAGEAFKNNDEMIKFAELVNKQFSISGASPWERSAGSYQLTQAMSSGRLQGDEFRSIIENAPLLAKTIRDSLGVGFMQLKEMSKEGKITAEVIKAALLSTADETNKAFEKIPMQFSSLWTQSVNKIDKGLVPLYQKFSAIWNNPKFQHGLDLLTDGILQVSRLAIWVIAQVAGIASAIANNWSVIAPIVYGVGGAFLFLRGVMAGVWVVTKLMNIATLASVLLKGAYVSLTRGAAVATRFLSIGTAGATMAQWGLNAAIFACPLTWIVLGIIALIAIIALLVNFLAKAAGRTLTFWEAVVAGIYAIGAFLINAVFAFLNLVINLFISRFIEPLIAVIDFMVNAFTGGFDNILDAGINLFGQLTSVVLQFAKVLTPVIDALFGTEWTKGLTSIQNKAVNWGKNNNATKIDRSFYDKLQIPRIKYEDAIAKGIGHGGAISDKFDNFFKIGDKTWGEEGWFNAKDLKEYQDLLKSYNADDMKGINGNTGKIAGNTGKIADNTKELTEGINITDEDIELLKEYARINFVNRFTTMTPQVNANFGDVHQTADVGGIKDLLAKEVQDALDSHLS